MFKLLFQALNHFSTTIWLVFNSILPTNKKLLAARILTLVTYHSNLNQTDNNNKTLWVCHLVWTQWWCKTHCNSNKCNNKCKWLKWLKWPKWWIWTKGILASKTEVNLVVVSNNKETWTKEVNSLVTNKKWEPQLKIQWEEWTDHKVEECHKECQVQEWTLEWILEWDQCNNQICQWDKYHKVHHKYNKCHRIYQTSQIHKWAKFHRDQWCLQPNKCHQDHKNHVYLLFKKWLL